MHGDYKIDNVIWTRQAPPRILAVLDFEMTTIGDPLVDLAWALIFWPEEGT
jgi:aminoglycoside phosphotransferase (APT) family kinase protein